MSHDTKAGEWSVFLRVFSLELVNLSNSNSVNLISQVVTSSIWWWCQELGSRGGSGSLQHRMAALGVPGVWHITAFLPIPSFFWKGIIESVLTATIPQSLPLLQRVWVHAISETDPPFLVLISASKSYKWVFWSNRAFDNVWQGSLCNSNIWAVFWKCLWKQASRFPPGVRMGVGSGWIASGIKSPVH